MKKYAASKTVKGLAMTLFCALFAFYTSISAQSGSTKNSNEIKEFRAHCTELLNALPDASAVQSSPAFSQSEKQKFQSVIKTLKDASQIKDNASDATFTSMKKSVEDVENWLLNFKPSGVHSAAKANDSPTAKSPLQICFEGCDATFDSETKTCTGGRKERTICRAGAIGRMMACKVSCGFN